MIETREQNMTYYYVLTFHKVRVDGSTGLMIDNPMVFDSREGAIDYGRHHVDYTNTDFRVHETVLFSQPKLTVDI